jgi:hypothetical protein
MTLTELKLKYPNDFDLGNAFANCFEFVDDVNEYMSARIVGEHPNYYELGDYLRNHFEVGND